MASGYETSLPLLTEVDVPGATFVYAKLEKHSVDQLRRWLACRGLKRSGNKSALLERCRNVISLNKCHLIDPSVDQEKWYEMKSKRQKLSADVSTNSPPAAPDSGWLTFPESVILKMFNEGRLTLMKL
ncbi:hypothetical protein LSAT2_000458 [Lamellibrachia satsuma]|nr:hypothetical protein LSAT2_000458 [Lamellibrachia satsuma]